VERILQKFPKVLIRLDILAVSGQFPRGDPPQADQGLRVLLQIPNPDKQEEKKVLSQMNVSSFFP